MNDDRLPASADRYLGEASRLEPPSDLLDAVMREVDGTPQRRAIPRSLLSLGVVAVLVGAILLSPGSRPPGSDSPAGPAPQASGAAYVTPPALDSLPSGGAVEAEIDLPAGAYPASAGHGALWIGNERSGEVMRLDPKSNEIVGTIEVNPSASGYNLWPVADEAWVWSSGVRDQTLVRIDPETNAIDARFGVQAVPYRIASSGSEVWFTNFDGGEVVRVSAATGEVQARIDLPSASGIVIRPDGVWVAQYRYARLVRIDPATNTVNDEYPIFRDATDLVAHGADIWIVGNNGRLLERFDTANRTVAARTDAMTALVIVDGVPWAAHPAGTLVSLDREKLAWTSVIDLGEVELDQMIGADGRLWTLGTTDGRSILYRAAPSPP